MRNAVIKFLQMTIQKLIPQPSTATAVTTNCLDTKEILMSPKSSNLITGDISESLKIPTKVDFDISSPIIDDSFSVLLPISASNPESSSSTNINSKHEQKKGKLGQVMLDNYSKEMKKLWSERNNLYRHIEKLESRHLSYKEINKNNKTCEYYTGISIDKFNILFHYIEDGLSKTSPRTMSHKDQLLTTLVKLVLNTQF